jgi:hypothetical protein
MPPSRKELSPWEVFVAARGVFTVVQGLGSRFHQLASPRAGARTAGWRMAAVGCGAGDVVKAIWLSKDGRFHLLPRLVLDAADLALWCLCADDDTDTSEDAVIPGVPLAAEAGARLGPRGLVVPVVNAAVATLVRRARGHRLRLDQFTWQLMGVGGGWALAVIADRQRQRSETLHDIDLAARTQQAHQAGLHDALLEHNGVIDLLQRATALVELGVTDRPAARQDLSGELKAEAARAVRERHVYLRDALSLWQTRHNLNPDLSQVVDVELAEGDGTIVLSAEQAAALHQWLDTRELRGMVSVEVGDPTTARSPLGFRRLVVNGETIDLPGVAATRRWTLDALPAAFLMNLGWLAQPMARHREEVPWTATAPAMALTAGGGLWAAYRGDGTGTLDPRVALSLGLATALLYTWTSTRSMRRPHTAAGVPRFPWAMPLQGYELVRGLISDRLGPRWRVPGLAGTGLIVAMGWKLGARPRSLRALVAELGWVVGFDVISWKLRRILDDMGAAMASEAEASDEEQLRRAYQTGRGRLVGLVGRSLVQGRQTLDDTWSLLSADLREEAARRFDRVEELRGAAASRP